MLRLTVALVAVLCLASSTRAGLVPQKDRLGPKKDPVRQAVKKEAGARVHLGEFVISEDTEIKLDGRPCKFHDVPGSASIILLEVAAHDRTAVLRVHFRTNE